MKKKLIIMCTILCMLMAFISYRYILITHNTYLTYQAEAKLYNIDKYSDENYLLRKQTLDDFYNLIEATKTKLDEEINELIKVADQNNVDYNINNLEKLETIDALNNSIKKDISDKKNDVDNLYLEAVDNPVIDNAAQDGLNSLIKEYDELESTFDITNYEESYILINQLNKKLDEIKKCISDHPYIKPITKPNVVYEPKVDNSYLMLVNKQNPLSSDYNPGGLLPIVETSFSQMQSDAKKEGYEIHIQSGFRSYQTQVSTFDYWVSLYGEEQARRVSAEPGFSEHQTGLSLDFSTYSSSCTLQECYGNEDEAIWVANNAHKYGFIIRYPQGKESITGYSYEPWHIRYVGVDDATKIYNNNQTLEEYLGVS